MTVIKGKELPEELYLCRHCNTIEGLFINPKDCGMNSIGICDIDSEKCEASKYIKED